jgi:hypothetical protein
VSNRTTHYLVEFMIVIYFLDENMVILR